MTSRRVGVTLPVVGMAVFWVNAGFRTRLELVAGVGVGVVVSSAVYGLFVWSVAVRSGVGEGVGVGVGVTVVNVFSEELVFVVTPETVFVDEFCEVVDVFVEVLVLVPVVPEPVEDGFTV